MHRQIQSLFLLAFVAASCEAFAGFSLPLSSGRHAVIRRQPLQLRAALAGIEGGFLLSQAAEAAAPAAQAAAQAAGAIAESVAQQADQVPQEVTGPAIEIFGNAVPPILLILLPIGVGTLIFSAIAWIITQTIYIPTDMRKVGRRSLPSDDEQL